MTGGRARVPSRLVGRLIVVVGLAAGCADPSSPAGPDPRVDTCGSVGSGVAQGGRGSIEDAEIGTTRRLVLIGGGREDDDASRTFVESAGGGDVLVLRASGSTTSYPDYFVDALAPSPAPAAAVTLRLDTPGSGANPGVLCRVSNAEAIWLAGGNQWDYLGRWPSLLHDSLGAVSLRGMSIGGTSAGAVSLGEGVFDAREGSVTSVDALSDPLGSDVSVSLSPFAQPELAGLLVDSHFSERGREGRLLAFLARFALLTQRDTVRGIGLDEGMALVIEADTWSVHGPAGAYVWVYESVGSPTLSPGDPLDLDDVTRLRLGASDSGAWPIDLGAWPMTRLSVVDGVVVSAPPTDARTIGRP